MFRLIERNFGILLLLSASFAFFVPLVFLPFRGITDELLMFALFLGCLKIDFTEIFHLKANLGKMISFVLLNMILLPLVFFLLSFGLDADIRIGFFMLLAVSGAVATPLLASFLRLKILWSSVFVILTSFLVPFTLPLLIRWLFGVSIEISTVGMILFLAKIIFIPAGLAIFFKSFFPKQVRTALPYTGFIGSLSLAFFLGILVAVNRPSLVENLFHISTLPILLLLFIIFVFRFILGYRLPAENSIERWTNSLMFGNMNNGLIILLAAQFFSPKVLFIVLLSEVPWVLAQPVFQRIIHKYHKK